ncbi:MAG: UxaA family hydrolase [Casimicrobiaceae bacterium]
MKTFLGYRRANGDVGIRNYLLVLSIAGLTGPAARRVARALPGARLVTMPYGGGLLGEDRAVHLRSLAGFGRNPNVGAVLLIGSDPPKLAALGDEIAGQGTPVACIGLDDCGHDALTLTDRALRAGARLQRDLSRQRRVEVALDKLFLGVECGRSDPSSGMVANPLIGSIVDAVVYAGGRAVFGEAMEWLGAEHLLARRGANAAVGDALVRAVGRREGVAIHQGLDLLGDNPGPTNIAAGLSTIEEKSLGSIAKSGSAPINAVLGVGERPRAPGLYAMDGPAYSPESLSGFVAAGAQLLLFSTGVGNSYVSTLAPTLKLSANPQATGSLREQLDFDASAVFEGRQSLEEVAAALLDVVLDIASGTQTWGEVLDEGDEVVSRMGEAL